MSISKKVIAVIVGAVFAFLTLASAGAVLLVKEINKPKALTGDANLSIGNMLKDNNTIDFNTYQKLLTALGNDTTSIRNSASINNGEPIVFQMGTVTDSSGKENPIYWQVVYQTADYITIWMTNSYTEEYYNRSGSSIKNSTLLGYTTGPYSDTGNYSQSVIHDLTKKIYDKVSTTFPVFADVVVAPSTVKTVNDWQTTQGNGKYGIYYAITNGLGSNVSTGSSAGASNPNNFQWNYSSCMDDMFWIPSFYEVFNTSTSSATYTNGYWGLSSSTYIVDNSSTALDGTSTSQFCWLRSGLSGNSNIAMLVDSSGSVSNRGVTGSHCVRPACHLSLPALKNAATSIGNMLKNNNEISYNAYQSLLTVLGNDTTSTRNKAEINGGNVVIFQMGEVNGKPIYWQVVYQVGDIITIWMTDCYTNEYYNYSGTAVKNSALAGYANGPYHNYSNYSKSVLRDVTVGIYGSLTTSFPVIANIVKSPSEAGATWQQTEKEDVYTLSSSSYDHHNNLWYNPDNKSSYGGSYTGWSHSSNWNFDNQPYSDKFWIPSSAEVFNNKNGQSVEKGLWGLTATDRGFATSTLDGLGVSSCWLRSGFYNSNYSAMQVTSSGNVDYYNVNRSYGVRPACHLSLSALLENLDKYIVTATVNNNILGTVLGDGLFSANGTESATITATPNYGYLFNYWLEESTGNKIYNNPYTFTVTRHETYTAYFSGIGINITTENSGAEILYQIADNTTTTYNFDIKFTTSNYLTQIKFSGDSVPRSIKSVQTVYGDVANCTLATVGVNTDGSKAYISISAPTDSITITLYFTNTAQNYKATSGGGGVETVAVQSTIGGSAELVGDDYTNLTSGDTITVVARFKLNGYQFDGWYIDGELITTDMSARLTYDDIKGKVIVAQFSKIDSKTNTDTNTPDTGGFV